MGVFMNKVYILSATRTPIGSFLGNLSQISATRLGGIAIKEACLRAKISTTEINQVFMGNVLSSGLGQAPARQAAIYGGLPNTVPCTTVNKVCGSGMQAVILGAEMIKTSEAEIVVAGGMENMSQVPFALENIRGGYKMGHQKLTDLMIKDGLWDVYNNYHMGDAGELCARELKISREEQDNFAETSYKKAQNAVKGGKFKDEIIPIEIEQKQGKITISEDEEPFKVNFEKIRSLRPAFQKDGTITAANASSINDGASALVIASENYVNKNNLKPLASIVGYGSYACAPEWFTTAPVYAIENTLKKLKLSISDIDNFEINEAFSVVSLACYKKLNLDSNKVNINGGAVALGHPIGASGARILTTLIYALKNNNKKRGLSSLCIGGGEALAMVVEI
jgi:acetyl-CoA C-acetyltransferase